MKSWQNSAAITQDRGSFELERKYHVTYYQVVGKDLMRECILKSGKSAHRPLALLWSCAVLVPKYIFYL